MFFLLISTDRFALFTDISGTKKTCTFYLSATFASFEKLRNNEKDSIASIVGYVRNVS